MRFLGIQTFCKNFSVIVEPLTSLLRKRQTFTWSKECQDAFVVLAAPDFTREFKLAVDASDIGAGAVLLQEDFNGIDRPICYYSKKFSKSQRNYCTTEKKLLALVLALHHFDVYLTAAEYSLVVFTDHNPLTFLHKLKNKNQRLMRWSLMLQQYNLVMKHIKGPDNIIVDTLSRAG